MKKVAYLGLPGSYSYLAAKKYFGENQPLVSCEAFENIIDYVNKNEVYGGVLPMENSLTGSIYQTYDLLLNTNLKINGELVMRINHCLLVNKLSNIKTSKLKQCFSHPEAIKQCHNFLKVNSHLEAAFVSDTASAARILAERKNGTDCAIGSQEAAQIYDLKLKLSDIQDNRNNFTRFVIVGKTENSAGNKVSLVFSVEHIPGSLFKTLEPYARLGLNLTKIESRPVVGLPWEYLFIVDFVIGHKKQELQKLLSEMKEHVNFIKILGRYDSGKIYES